jgi:zinc protease
MPSNRSSRSLLVHTAAGLAVLALAALPVAGQVKKSTELRFPPLTPLTVPEPTRVELDNGMVVLLIEDHELPLVEARALIRTGTRLDPADKAGLGRLAAGVLRSGGSQGLAGDALDEALENRGASIEVTVRPNVTGASMSSLRQDFPAVLQMLADLLRRPTFDANKFDLAKSRAVAQVARQNDSPPGIAFRELGKLVYGSESPYGKTETYLSLKNVERADLVEWHRQYFHPDRVLLGLVGDFNKDEVVAQVKKAFGDWPRGPEATLPAVPYRKEANPGVFFVEKNDVTQSVLLMGHLGILRSDPDYFALEVANDVLSGGFSSRLLSNIRTKKGLAYSVFGGVQSEWDYPGLALLNMGTKTGSAGAGIAALLEEARGMKERPPTDEEVANAKESILNAFVFRMDTTDEILNQRLLLEFFRYPADWVERYRAGIEAVTPQQVRDAAARHLRPADFSIVVVGPSAGMDRPLSDFGPVTRLDIAIPGAPAPPPAKGAAP